jgi:DnaJ-domain-containing protein 1
MRPPPAPAAGPTPTPAASARPPPPPRSSPGPSLSSGTPAAVARPNPLPEKRGGVISPPPPPGSAVAEPRTEVALPVAAPPKVSGPVPAGVDPAFAAEVEMLFGQLGEVDYFQLLRLAPDAAAGDIKRAYHQGSRAFHPDRFFQVADAEFTSRVDQIYKRMNEAYVVLRDDRKRAKYAADVASPNRAAKLRFNEESETESKQAAKKEKEEEIGKTPQGRKFFEQGSKDLAAGRFADAHRNFKMAFTFEPGNALYKEKLVEAEKALPKSDFKIR